MTRYHPALVALHWLLALCIILALVAGNVLLEDVPNYDPQKIAGLRNHMTLGLAIGALMLLRLGVRLTTRKPPRAPTGQRFLDLAARAAHWTLYGLVFVMVASGIGIALSADLFGIIRGNGAPLPEDFWIHPPRILHWLASVLLMLTLAAHVAGWAYHSFVLKDGLTRRMWFGPRT